MMAPSATAAAGADGDRHAGARRRDAPPHPLVHGVEPGVLAAAGQQLGVAPLLDHPPLRQDHDPVGVADGAQRWAMTRWCGGRPSLMQRLQGPLLALSVSRALVASSRIWTGGFLRKWPGRAMASRCRWPPDSRVPRSRWVSK